MSKLSEETLTKGRQFVVAEDLVGLNLWVAQYASIIDRKFVSDTFEKLFLTHDSEKALKMFNAAFSEYDASLERTSSIIRLVVPAITLLGALGGILYLVRSLLGH